MKWHEWVKAGASQIFENVNPPHRRNRLLRPTNIITLCYLLQTIHT